MIFSDAKQSAEASILAVARITTAALVVFAVACYTPSSALRRNILLSIGGCLSLPATLLTLGSIGCFKAFHLIQKGATKNLMKVVGLVAASYAVLEFHDIWKFGLIEPAFSWAGKKLTDPLAKGKRISSAFIQKYFPPQPLKDVNPFNVRSQKDAERVLLAAQRIAAGVLVAFLAFRYAPVLSRMYAGRFISLAGFAACYTLSVPATLIASSTFLTTVLIESIRKRQLTKETMGIVGINYVVWGNCTILPIPARFLAGVTVGRLTMWMAKWPLTYEHIVLFGALESFSAIMPGYQQQPAPTPLMPHFFNKIFLSSPNLLDKVFITIAQRHSGTAFRYLGRVAK
jgi:hypothetical protein